MAKREVVDQYMPNASRRRYASLQAEYADDIMGTARRIFSYFKNEMKLVTGLAVVILLGTLAGVCAPAIQSRAIDIIAGEATGDFTITLGLMLGAYLIGTCGQFVQGLLCAKMSTRIVKRIRGQLFDHVIDLPISYHDRHPHGDTMSRMTNDVDNISTTISQALPTLIAGVLTITGTTVAMLLLCWQLALLTCLTIGLTIAATRFLSARVRKYSRTQQASLGEVSGMVEEMVAGFRTVVASNRQQRAVTDFCEATDKLTAAGIRTNAFSGIMGPVSSSISNIGYAIVAVFGGFLALQGVITIGVISAFIVYMRQFSRPVNEIAQLYCQLQTAIAGAERVFAVIDEAGETADEADKEKAGLAAEGISAAIDRMPDKAFAASEALRSGQAMEKAPTIEFEDVTFSYEEGKPVLSNFSFTVPAGKKVALVGATGSGKTTIANLVLRFYDVDSGRILLSGRDIRDITRERLRQRIAIVLQDTTLFGGTIRENLLYANENATESQLREAARASCCLRMIERLPEGFDTCIGGSGGMSLSHGQQQLLSIARAFLANPDVLILDEATSNVDTRTEQAVQKAMLHLMQDRTSIVIAHRLSTVRDADVIVVLDHGRIVEQGTHEELLKLGGRYHELYMTQFAGFTT
ncbi:MAG: ABC transporter ATP-binding protein [Eggerthellaceae bacterium]|nr:ABC transporter ATP-binding protein [Eggerthellaceae bacterium]